MKWLGNIAISLDNFMGKQGEETTLSNKSDWRVVHKMRSVASAIVVGSTTVLTDNPSLKIKNEFIDGEFFNPIRVIFDRRGRVTSKFKVMKQNHVYPTIWITNSEETRDNIIKLPFTSLSEVCKEIENIVKSYITSPSFIMVEGGPSLLSTLINEGIIKKIRIFRNEMILKGGNSIFNKITKNLELVHSSQLLNGTENFYRIS